MQRGCENLAPQIGEENKGRKGKERKGAGFSQALYMSPRSRGIADIEPATQILFLSFRVILCQINVPDLFARKFRRSRIADMTQIWASRDCLGPRKDAIYVFPSPVKNGGKLNNLRNPEHIRRSKSIFENSKKISIF